MSQTDDLPAGWQSRMVQAVLILDGAQVTAAFARLDRGAAIRLDAQQTLARLVATPLVERMRPSPTLRRLRSVRQAEQAAGGALAEAQIRLRAADAAAKGDHGTDLDEIQAVLDNADSARAAVTKAEARLNRVREMATAAARAAQNEMQAFRGELLQAATRSVMAWQAELHDRLAAAVAPLLDELVGHRIVAEALAYGLTGAVDVEALAAELPIAGDAAPDAAITETAGV